MATWRPAAAGPEARGPEDRTGGRAGDSPRLRAGCGRSCRPSYGRSWSAPPSDHLPTPCDPFHRVTRRPPPISAPDVNGGEPRPGRTTTHAHAATPAPVPEAKGGQECPPRSRRGSERRRGQRRAIRVVKVRRPRVFWLARGGLGGD